VPPGFPDPLRLADFGFTLARITIHSSRTRFAGRLNSGVRRTTGSDMESIIYICGAIIFGIGYAFLKPTLDGPWLIAIAVAYFGLLRLTASAARRYASRRALARSPNDKPA